MLEAEFRALLEKHGLPPDLARELDEHLRQVHSELTMTAVTRAAPVAPVAPDAALDVMGPDDAGERYEDRGLLGRGGMGEVRRVFDRRLNRELAMKTLRLDISGRPHASARFFEEAQVTAQLQHPAIISLHDFGRLADGRLFFTMKEVKGRTLMNIITEVHAASLNADAATGLALDGGWRASASGWTLRRLLDAFRRVCDAVAYAHSRGVLHRDLKPQNVMVGDFGEVLVMDWGLTRAARQGGPDVTDAPVTTQSLRQGEPLTVFGSVTGTPSFMSPEQASGDPSRIGPASDIYGLGATLYCILAGHAPYHDDPSGMLVRPPSPVPERAGWRPDGPITPPELRLTCAAAMAWSPDERPKSASDLAQSIAEWLDGAQRQARAIELISEARALDAGLAERHRQADDLRARADDILIQTPPFAPVPAKLPAWQLQDRAEQLEREVDEWLGRRTQLLRGALTHAQDLEAAHIELADMFHDQHATAEARHDARTAEALEPLLREHDRGKWRDYLAGDGYLDLVTSPAGASVTLFQLVEEQRVMVPRLLRDLGTTPIARVPLPMGDYLVTISAEGCQGVRYPVFIEREHYWNGVPQGASAPYPIPLPALGQLGPDDCYVPAGWFQSGGDPAANNSLPQQRLWLDGFVMRRFPVTIAEFVVFLNDLAVNGRLDDAKAFAPQAPAWEQGQTRHEHGVMFGDDGRFVFAGPPEDLRRPVVQVSWAGAAAYAAWLAEREGLPWRLPAEMEHEKALRGVNGSPFPWGRHLDPTFCKMRHSTAGEGRNVRASVDEFPVDESIYGIRGLAGNVHAWCIDPYQPRGPKIVNGVPQISDGSDVRGPGAHGVHRIVRGGSWRDPEANLRGAFRDSPPATYRDTTIGFRVCRPVTTFGV